MKAVVWPLALAMVAALGCGSSSKTPPGPGGDPGNGGGPPIGGGPDGGDGDGGRSACSIINEETRLTQTGTPARLPAMIGDGSGFLVVWSDERKGNGDIYGAKIDGEGKKTSEWVLIEGAENSMAPSLARLGSGFLLAWFDKTPIGADVKTIVLGADGKATGMASLIAATSSDNPRPIVTSAFGGAALAWSDKKGTTSSASIAWLNSSGQLTIPAVSLGTMTAGVEFPAPAASEDKLAVFYSDARDGHLNLRATLFNDQLVQQQDVLVRDANDNAVNARAVWDGQQFVAAWEDLRSSESEQVDVSRLASDGKATTPAPVPETDAEANWPTLAATRQGVAIAYYQFRNGRPQIIVSYMTKGGEMVRPDLQLSQTTGKARFPSIAYDGKSLLGVAWEDSRAGHQEIYFARIECP